MEGRARKKVLLFSHCFRKKGTNFVYGFDSNFSSDLFPFLFLIVIK